MNVCLKFKSKLNRRSSHFYALQACNGIIGYLKILLHFSQYEPQHQLVHS